MGWLPKKGLFPDIGQIEAVLDQDFSALTAKLDQLIALEQQILDTLKAGQAPAGATS